MWLRSWEISDWKVDYASPAFHIHPVGLAMNAVLQGNVDFTVISESTVEGFLSSEFVLALPPGF